jgi:hypothetical protein
LIGYYATAGIFWLEIRRAFVGIVASQDICEEDDMEFSSSELLDKSLPVLDIVVARALVSRILEKARHPGTVMVKVLRLSCFLARAMMRKT